MGAARAALGAGQPGRAEAALAEAVRIGTVDPLVQDLIGAVFSALGDQIAAEAWYRRAATKQPNAAGFWLNLANSLIFLGRNDEAQASLARALEADPDHPQAHWLLASARRATSLEHVTVLEQLRRISNRAFHWCQALC
jgi:predicted Zn-dependent protease